MKLPEVNKIVGYNKRRDFLICYDWLNGAMTLKELGVKYSLTERRVSQILIINKTLLKVDKGFEKAKRIQALQVELKNAKASKKDKVDIIEQLRKELEGGNQVNIDNSKHYHFSVERLQRARERVANAGTD